MSRACHTGRGFLHRSTCPLRLPYADITVYRAAREMDRSTGSRAGRRSGLFRHERDGLLSFDVQTTRERAGSARLYRSKCSGTAARDLVTPAPSADVKNYCSSFPLRQAADAPIHATEKKKNRSLKRRPPPPSTSFGPQSRSLGDVRRRPDAHGRNVLVPGAVTSPVGLLTSLLSHLSHAAGDLPTGFGSQRTLFNCARGSERSLEPGLRPLSPGWFHTFTV